MNTDKSDFMYSNNGGNIKTKEMNSTVIKLKNFQHFDINIGQSNQYGAQFDGLFSNLNVFEYTEKLNIQEMSSNPCSYDGSYLAWKNMEFDLNGNVFLMNFTSDDVCDSEMVNSDKIRLGLPTELTFIEANKSCHIFPDGKIAEYKTIEDIKYVNHLDNFHKCNSYWTAYSGRLMIRK